MRQAVILAGGLGTRQRPLTFTHPKALLPVGGTTIIQYTLKILSSLVDEVIVVIAQGNQRIPEVVGRKIGKAKIRYVEQSEARGTGDALSQAAPFLKDKFLVVNGDDLYLQKDIKKILQKFPSILVKKVFKASSFGVVSQKNGLMMKLVEKPKNSFNCLVNTGLYFVDKQIFATHLKTSERGELELTQAIEEFNREYPMRIVEAEYWLPISYPWDLLEANQFLLAGCRRQIHQAFLEKGVTIKGPVMLEKGVVIKSGSYLEGPLWIGKNSQVGPNAYLKPATMIGENCLIGANVEIENSIIGNDTQIHSFCWVGDSVIGQSVCLGQGTIITNMRFDKQTIKVKVKNKIVDSQRRKLGAILGDGVQIGIHSSLMPGVRIDPKIRIYPHSLIQSDIKNSQFYNEEKI